MIRENNSELLSINNKVTLYFSLGHQTGVVLSKQVETTLLLYTLHYQEKERNLNSWDIISLVNVLQVFKHSQILISILLCILLFFLSIYLRFDDVLH